MTEEVPPSWIRYHADIGGSPRLVILAMSRTIIADPSVRNFFEGDVEGRRALPGSRARPCCVLRTASCPVARLSTLQTFEAVCPLHYPISTGLTPKSGSRPRRCVRWTGLYVTKDLHQFVDQLRKQMNHRHMFSHWEVSYDKFTSRVLYQLPAHYASAATLQQHVQNRDFPST